MTLSAAIKSIETMFKSVRYGTEDPKVPYLCSGGEMTDGIQPGLYATEDLAVEAWLNFVRGTLRSYRMEDGPTLEWGLKPELLEFQMTMADRNGGHRLVTKRYAVKSQVRVK